MVDDRLAIILENKDSLNQFHYSSFLYWLLLHQHQEVFPYLQLTQINEDATPKKVDQ